MRWGKLSLRASFFGWLGPAGTPVSASAETKDRLEEIREVMLDMLGDVDTDERAQLGCRIRLATDIHTLWYARGALMHAAANRVGEVQARTQMQAITQQFEGLVVPRKPASLNRKR